MTTYESLNHSNIQNGIANTMWCLFQNAAKKSCAVKIIYSFNPSITFFFFNRLPMYQIVFPFFGSRLYVLTFSKGWINKSHWYASFIYCKTIMQY